MFKPELIPNNKKGVVIDWEERILNPTKWTYSAKKDGGRVQLFANGIVKGRSLKPIPSAHIQQMGRDINDMLGGLPNHIVIECEFYSPEMNFAEIMHFFRCADVTSDKEVSKLTKLWNKTKGGTVCFYKKQEYPLGVLSPELEKEAVKWDFPGRDVEWLTTWHDSLKFYAFGLVDITDASVTAEVRYNVLQDAIKHYNSRLQGIEPDLVLIPQVDFEHIDALYQAYDQALLDGDEGIVVRRKEAPYKFGRHTLNACNIFKIKPDDLEYDGEILSVEESTVAREGSERIVNELGRSKTSQLKEDRVPSGMAKGFKVKMDDGNVLTVSLVGYSHEDRVELLENASDYVGKWIIFTGMAPVKEGGCPRHAHFEKGKFRDAK